MKKKQAAQGEDQKPGASAAKPADKPKAKALTPAERFMRDTVRKHRASVRRPPN